MTNGDFVLLAEKIPADLLTSDCLKADLISLGECVPLLVATDVIRLTYGEGLSLKARLEARKAPETQEIIEVEEEPVEPEALGHQELDWPQEEPETPEVEEENGSLADDLFRNVPMPTLSSGPETELEPQPEETASSKPEAQPELQPEETAIPQPASIIIPQEPLAEPDAIKGEQSSPIFD